MDKFPQTQRTDLGPSEEDGPGYVKSSEKVGAGHTDYEHRQAKFSNSEFPNKESGEGKGF